MNKISYRYEGHLKLGLVRKYFEFCEIYKISSKLSINVLGLFSYISIYKKTKLLYNQQSNKQKEKIENIKPRLKFTQCSPQ